jgi:hypothetical protein
MAMMGAVPLSYPVIILSAWYRSALLGKFRAYTTNEANCVILEFGKTKIVVTPDAPQEFVAAVRESVQGICAEDGNAAT